MWAVPSPLPVSSFSFLSLSMIYRSSLALFSVIDLWQLSVSWFFPVFTSEQLSHTRPADCILPHRSDRPSLQQLYISFTVFLIYFSYYHLLSSFCHFPFLNSHLLSLSIQRKMKNHTALLWDFFSWLEHPPPTHPQLGDKCFSKKALLEVLEKDGDNSQGFQVNHGQKNREKNTSHHSVKWQACGTKGFILYLGVLWSERCFLLFWTFWKCHCENFMQVTLFIQYW